MQLESKKLLYDVQQAAESICEFAAGKSFTDYESDRL